MGALRLLVADAHEIVRKGLCAFVREQPGWQVAAEAHDGREAVEMTRQLRPEVAIMDIGMPVLNGLEATRLIARSGLTTKVLLLTMHDTDLLIQQAVHAGASGYLLKSDTVQDLVSAVEALRQGKTFYSQKVAQAGGGGYPLNREGQPGPRTPRLTGRQREVLQLLAEGHSSKEAGVALGISAKTAETHRANIMRRIDCHSLAGLVRYAIRNHIIEA